MSRPLTSSTCGAVATRYTHRTWPRCGLTRVRRRAHAPAGGVAEGYSAALADKRAAPRRPPPQAARALLGSPQGTRQAALPRAPAQPPSQRFDVCSTSVACSVLPLRLNGKCFGMVRAAASGQTSSAWRRWSLPPTARSRREGPPEVFCRAADRPSRARQRAAAAARPAPVLDGPWPSFEPVGVDFGLRGEARQLAVFTDTLLAASAPASFPALPRRVAP